MKHNIDKPRDLMRWVGIEMDLDDQRNIFGRKEVSEISWLVARPQNYEEAAEHIYERLRALGAEITITIDENLADKHAVVISSLLRSTEANE